MLQPSNDQWPNWKHDHGDDAAPAEKSSSPATDTPASDRKNLAEKTRYSRESDESVAEGMRYISLGTEFLAAILIGTALGWGLSWLLGMFLGYRPGWVVAIGILIGALAGFLNMYRFVVELEQKEEQRKRGSSK